MSIDRTADLALARVLRLASPMLPVGAFSYSQGLESAIEQGWVCDEASALRWIGDVLECNVGRFEAIVWCRLYRAWQVPSDADVRAVLVQRQRHRPSSCSSNDRSRRQPGKFAA